MADEKTTLTFADEEDVDLDLFKKRKSVRLLPENAKFSLSDGGLLSLTLTGEEGVESFERVVAVRSFPITEPDSFIAIREPDTKNKERGAEIGLIYAMSDFDEETQSLLRAELELRYFTPEITKIRSLKEKLGYIYCDAETSAGKFSFEFRNPHSNVRILEDKRVMISDIDGNCFVIRDPSKLDRASYKRIEPYL
jgi:hypothetical protein